MSIKHRQISTRPDNADTGDIQPSHWNDTHILDGLLALLDAVSPSANSLLIIDANGNAQVTPFAGLLALLGGAPLNSPVFLNAPAAPTATVGTRTSQLATTAFVGATVDALVASAPAALNTLKELADALGDDPNYATTIATALANRLRFDAAQTLTSPQMAQAIANLGIVFGTGAGNAVKLDGNAKLPAVDGSLLTNLPAAFRNVAWGNGGFDVWQRGAGGSAAISVAASTTAYTVDRWYLGVNASQAATVSQVAGLSSRSRWAAAVQRNAGQTGSGVMFFAYPLTTDEVVRLRGQTVSLQALLQAAANWSPAGGTLNAKVYFGTGTQGKRGPTPFTNDVATISTGINLTPGGAVQALSVTSAGTVPTNATQGEVQFTWTPAGTAGAADTFTIDDVQLEVGAPTASERVPFGVSLQDCKQHFCKSFSYNTAPAYGAASGYVYAIAGSSGFLGASTSFGCTMISSSPAVTTYSTTNAQAGWSTNTTTPTTSVTVSSDGVTFTGGGGTSGAGYSLCWTADAGL